MVLRANYGRAVPQRAEAEDFLYEGVGAGRARARNPGGMVCSSWLQAARTHRPQVFALCWDGQQMSGMGICEWAWGWYSAGLAGWPVWAGWLLAAGWTEGRAPFPISPAAQKARVELPKLANPSRLRARRLSRGPSKPSPSRRDSAPTSQFFCKRRCLSIFVLANERQTPPDVARLEISCLEALEPVGL